ncbi:MAG: hypothetical protein IT567_07070 [Alphaproteobacteria bacterium]|nr:hypothetical protein [Alphaproteobacteria bacterium]
MSEESQFLAERLRNIARQVNEKQGASSTMIVNAADGLEKLAALVEKLDVHLAAGDRFVATRMPLTIIEDNFIAVHYADLSDGLHRLGFPYAAELSVVLTRTIATACGIDQLPPAGRQV